MGDRSGNGYGDGECQSPYPWYWRGTPNQGGAGNGTVLGDGATYKVENTEQGDYWTRPMEQGFGSWF